MIRRPPRSTLFPTRRSSDLTHDPHPGARRPRAAARGARPAAELRLGDFHEPRSEEHTSELQSRLHLVCRLLLEKKKKHKDNSSHLLTTDESARCSRLACSNP